MQLDFMLAGQVHTNHTIFIRPDYERTTQRELADGHHSSAEIKGCPPIFLSLVGVTPFWWSI